MNDSWLVAIPSVAECRKKKYLALLNENLTKNYPRFLIMKINTLTMLNITA